MYLAMHNVFVVIYNKIEHSEDVLREIRNRIMKEIWSTIPNDNTQQHPIYFYKARAMHEPLRFLM